MKKITWLVILSLYATIMIAGHLLQGIVLVVAQGINTGITAGLLTYHYQQTKTNSKISDNEKDKPKIKESQETNEDRFKRLVPEFWSHAVEIHDQFEKVNKEFKNKFNERL